MAVTRCPGSGMLTERIEWPGACGFPWYALCPYCRRQYTTNRGGKLRAHKGLPPRADGGCPYRCPTECDFDCYFGTNPPENQEEGD